MIRILITNDDGIHSDGLIKLEEALKEVGDVYVVAPASEMSGASHSLTLARPLRIRQLDNRHWAIDGTPTDCVTLALNKILPENERPHICRALFCRSAGEPQTARRSKLVIPTGAQPLGCAKWRDREPEMRWPVRGPPYAALRSG